MRRKAEGQPRSLSAQMMLSMAVSKSSTCNSGLWPGSPRKGAKEGTMDSRQERYRLL